MRALHRFLHRKGIARVLNTSSRSDSRIGTGYVQARGPRLIAEALACNQIKHDPVARFDWDSLRITSREHCGPLSYRFHLTYRRI